MGDDAAPTPWQLSTSIGFFATDLVFTRDDGSTFDADMLQHMVAVGLSRDLDTITLGLRVGAVLGGHVDAGGLRHDIEPGVVVALSVDWRVLSAPVDPVSLALTLQLGVAHTTVKTLDDAAGWTALDVRAAVTVSRTIFDVLTPYFSVRVFGGPIAWRDALGADTTHVQLAAGVGLEVVPRLTLHVEGAVLSERGVFGGLGLRF